jgi:hypothetical protein
MKIWMLALAAVAALAGGRADAASTSVWVSHQGSDTAGCGSVAHPCATFQFAHDNAVAANGVINVLNSGSYGPVTITKPVSILNTGGAMAVIAPARGVNAVTINAPATAAVVLRGLTIEGSSQGKDGIVFNSGVSLVVSDCVIERFRHDGMFLSPNGSGRVHLSLSRLRVAENAELGISIEPRGSVEVHGALDAVDVTHNGRRGISINGDVSASASANILIRDVNVNGSLADGMAAAGGAVTMTTTRTISTGNEFGIGSYNGQTGPSQAFSYGDNRYKGNWLAESNAPTTMLNGQ